MFCLADGRVRPLAHSDGRYPSAATVGNERGTMVRLKLHPDVMFERAGDDWVAVDPRSSRAHRLCGPAAQIIDAVVAGRAVSEDTDQAAGVLVDEGLLVPHQFSATDRWSRRRVLTAGTAAAALGVSSFVLPNAGAAASPAPEPSTTVPSVPTVVTAINVGRRPWGVVTGNGNVWVANVDDGTVSRIDPATNSVIATILVAAAGDRIYYLTFDGTDIWVADYDDGALRRVSPATQTVTQNIPAGLTPFGIVSGAGSLWVTNYSAGMVTRIDPASGSTVATIVTGTFPYGVVYDGTDIWVANEGSGTVSRINPATDAVTATINVGSFPTNLAVASGSIWVATGTELVARINPLTNTVDATIDATSLAYGITETSGLLWVTNLNAGGLSRIDPSTDTTLGFTSVGSSPRGVTGGFGSVWVTNAISGPSTVTRIDP